MRSPPKRPVRGLMAYLIPFVFIIALLAGIAVILQRNVGLEDLLRFFHRETVKRENRATAVFTEGEVLVKRWSEDEERALSSDSSLEPGDRVRTGNDGLLVIRLFEGSEIRIDKNTAMTIVQLDRNDQKGHQIALNLDAGRIWRRGFAGNAANYEFLITLPRLMVSIADAAVLDLDASESAVRIIAGKVKLTVLDEIHGKKIALKHFELGFGYEFSANEANLSKLRSAASVLISPFSETFLSSEWVKWNLEKEEVLGLIAPLPKKDSVTVKEPELEPLPAGLVTVAFPTESQKTSGKILANGTYDKEKIEKIFVNDVEAVLGIQNEWEAAVTVVEINPELVITALQKGMVDKKLVTRMKLVVDASGPILGKILQPIIDANGNGVLTSDRLELIGEVGPDAKKVCVAHQDDEPFCLKQWKPGDKTYTYYGAVKFGNVVKGKNKYTITTVDELENVSTKTIYLFKDVPKPEVRMDAEPVPSSEASTGGSGSTTPASTEFAKPVILIPDPSTSTETSEKTILINGTVDARTRSILINGKKAPYTVGSGAFDILYDLEPGENLIKIQAVNEKGEKSKLALLTVIYIEKSVPAFSSPTP